MIKKLFSNSLIYGLAPQISQIAGLLVLPLITPFLTEEDFGIWGVIIAYSAMINGIAYLGLGVVISNSLVKHPHHFKWMWRQYYGFLYLWSFIFGIILFMLMWYVLPIDDLKRKLTVSLSLCVPVFLFGPTSIFGHFYYLLKQEPLPIALRSVLFGLLAVCLNYFFIAKLKIGYLGWVYTTFTITMLTGLSYWIPLNFKLKLSPIFKFKQRTIKKSLQVGLPTVPHQYSNFLLNSSDKIVLERLNVGIDNLGIYEIAAKFGSYFSQMANAINTAIGPMMLELYKNKDDRKVRDLIFIFQFVMMTVTFFVSIWSKEIFRLLIKNETLSQAYPLFIILAMSYSYRPMYIGSVQKLFYLEKTQHLWKISLVGGVLNIVLNLILVPIYGFKVAAATTFLSLMYLGFSGYYIKSVKNTIELEYYPFSWFLAIVNLTLLSYLVVEYEVWTKVLITLFVGFILGFVILTNWQRLKSI